MELLGAVALAIAVAGAIRVFRADRRDRDTKADALREFEGQYATIGATRLVSTFGNGLYEVEGYVTGVDRDEAGGRPLLQEVTVDTSGLAPAKDEVERDGLRLTDVDWIEAASGERVDFTDR